MQGIETKGIRPVAPYRVLICRTVVAFCMVFVAYRACCYFLPSQLESPPFTIAHYDVSLWLYKLTGLAYLIGVQPFTANIFTILLFATGLLSVLFPMQRRLAIPFSICYILMGLASNIFLTHNAGYLGGTMWVVFVLWPRSNRNFELVWEGLRYYACYVYAIAFLFRLLGGGFFQWNGGVLYTQANLAEYIFHNPHTLWTGIYTWMFQHPFLLNLGYKLVSLTESAFIIGFFTKKADIFLIACQCFIVISTYFFADVFFAELMILSVTLMPVRWWRWLWLKTVPKAIQ